MRAASTPSTHLWPRGRPVAHICAATLAALAVLAILADAVTGLGANAVPRDWSHQMSQVLARTALAPRLQAPSAWAIIEPYSEGDLSTETGGNGGADADTPYLIGSLSKSLTAAATMRLADSGVVRLDDPVSDYLPGFRSQDAEPVTIAQLLSHTSGFTAASGRDAIADPTLSIAERAAGANAAIRNPPSGTTSFEYSNLNYAILGAIIEAAGGEPFASFMEQELFTPLGMHGSSADHAVAQELAASGHLVAFGVPLPHRETVPMGAAPDGYMVSTANDLAAFLRMLLRWGVADDGARVLSEESVRAVITDHAGASASGVAAPDTTGYGFGWGTGGTAEHPIAAHVGRTEGYFAHAYLRQFAVHAVVVLQAANGPLYDQTAPARFAVAGLEGSDRDDAAVEPAAVTAAIFLAFGAVAFGAVALSSWLRKRRDVNAATGTSRRALWRAARDVCGAILIVLLWFIAAGAMFTGRPSLGTNPWLASTELTLIVAGLALVLVVRAARGWSKFRA